MPTTFQELHPRLLSKDAAPFLLVPAFFLFFDGLFLREPIQRLADALNVAWTQGLSIELARQAALPFLKTIATLAIEGWILWFFQGLARRFLRLERGELQAWTPGKTEPDERLSFVGAVSASLACLHYRFSASKQAVIHIETMGTEEEPRQILLPVGRNVEHAATKAFLAAVQREIKQMHPNRPE